MHVPNSIIARLFQEQLKNGNQKHKLDDWLFTETNFHLHPSIRNRFVCLCSTVVCIKHFTQFEFINDVPRAKGRKKYLLTFIYHKANQKAFFNNDDV